MPLLFQSAARQHASIYDFDMGRLDSRDVDLALSHCDYMICGLGLAGLDGEDERPFAGGGHAHVC